MKVGLRGRGILSVALVVVLLASMVGTAAAESGALVQTPTRQGQYSIMVEREQEAVSSAQVYVRDDIDEIGSIWIEQGKIISGEIRDAEGNLIPEARVLFRTTPFHETTADEDGGFSLMLPANREYELLYELDGRTVSMGYFMIDEEGNMTELIPAETVITLDDEAFTLLDKEDRVYLVEDVVEAFSGTIRGKPQITGVSVTLRAFGLTLLETAVPAGDTWTVGNLCLLLGRNDLTVTTVDTEGVETSVTFILYNTNEDNIDTSRLDEADDDNDGLRNWLEAYCGTDPQAADTDGDGLTDYEELFITLTDPLLADTDENGTPDGEEDFDGDGLTNWQEIRLNGNPYMEDTDGDGLTDAEEYHYGTRLDQADSDGDGLSDKIEIDVGTYPLNPDSNYNGIGDGEETRAYAARGPVLADQQAWPRVEGMLTAEQIASIRITEVEAAHPLLHEGIPGYIDHAYTLSVPGELEDAVLSFELDKALVERMEPGVFEPRIYAFDAETQLISEMEGQWLEANTLSAPVAREGQFLLLNKVAFDIVWETEIRGFADTETSVPAMDITLVIDISGSMADNDPRLIRYLASQEVVRRLNEKDRVSVVLFNNEAYVEIDMTAEKEAVLEILNRGYASGGTAIFAGMEAGLAQFAGSEETPLKVMMILTDGQDNEPYDYTPYVEAAKDDNIVTYTIGLGPDVYEELLRDIIAEPTGGAYYHAEVADALFDQLILMEETIDPDKDGDLLWDEFEQGGIRLGNGVVLYTDPANPDTDGDGLLDGEELEMVLREDGETVHYFRLHSDPTKADSDGDGFDDMEEASQGTNPLRWDVGDRDLAMFAALTYETPGAYASGAFVGDGDREPDETYYFLDFARADEVRGHWSVEDFAHIRCGLDTHFTATTYRNGDALVVAFRGTDGELGEWANNLLGYGVASYHVEELQARAYIEKIARRYPDCDLYITGHSLGGYLAQIAAAHLVQRGLDGGLARVAYFNGMGINIVGVSGLPSMMINNQATLFTLLTLGEAGKLVCHRIAGDIVSGLGAHAGQIITYKPTEEAKQNQARLRSPEPGSFEWLDLFNPVFYGEFVAGIIQEGASRMMQYVWYTHETDSFFYYLRQGGRAGA